MMTFSYFFLVACDCVPGRFRQLMFNSGDGREREFYKTEGKELKNLGFMKREGYKVGVRRLMKLDYCCYYFGLSYYCYWAH
ncbi:hypothetical protein HanRHA438_Chr17g0839691 [Helianthus annuus]|nr:hypothetical protein HanRHA438_Chr17g0839691 [Helianthus annuus]